MRLIAVVLMTVVLLVFSGCGDQVEQAIETVPNELVDARCAIRQADGWYVVDVERTRGGSVRIVFERGR